MQGCTVYTARNLRLLNHPPFSIWTVLYYFRVMRSETTAGIPSRRVERGPHSSPTGFAATPIDPRQEGS